MINVQVSLPSYDGRLSIGAMKGIIQANLNPKINTILKTCDCSALTRVFNTLWCDALNDRPRTTHFAMIHDDICPQPGWLEIMLHIMEQKKCDVLSAIVPQKTTQGLTSTAWDHGGYNIQRITMKEAFKMDVTFGGDNLLVNTGLMLVDMRKDWVEQISFKFIDDIVKKGDKYVPVEVSEDWQFSRDARNLGAKLMATRAVDAKHFGRAAYVNSAPWGSLETDAKES